MEEQTENQQKENPDLGPTNQANPTNQKSMGVAILLSFLFGPLGLFYSTVTGGIVMIVVNLIVAFLTVGFGLLFTWPACVIWAAIATNNHNNQV